MTLYLDLIWLLNFLLDLMILMLTNYFLKMRTNIVRLIFGAVVASSIVLITIYFPGHFFTTLIGKLCYSAIIVLCTFGMHKIFKLLHILLVFYMTTFVIGGGLTAIHSLIHPIEFQAHQLMTFHSGYGHPVSWLFVIIGFPIVLWLSKVHMDRYSFEKLKYDQLYPVTIHMAEKEFSTFGYVDSANHLVDPLTQQPVIICDEVFLKQWFTDEDWYLIEQANKQLDLSLLPGNWKQRIRIVPFQGIGGQREFMLVVKPDQLMITVQKELITVQRVLIGIQFAKLTKDGAYHCLLHPKVFKKYSHSA